MIDVPSAAAGVSFRQSVLNDVNVLGALTDGFINDPITWITYTRTHLAAHGFIYWAVPVPDPLSGARVAASLP